MIESIDHDIGRLLVESKLATRRADGTLDYDPAKTNTMIVVIGDNGSYAFTVKAPFDPLLGKGFVNQTGVWVPLIVAGPQVVQPGRTVDAMINVADLYELFGELAGVKVRDVVPPNRGLDSVSMLPYLTNPTQSPIRDYNFTQTGSNIRASTTAQYPCVVESIDICALIIPQKPICEYLGGTWYGPSPSVTAAVTNAAASDGAFSSCCEVNKALIAANKPIYKILPDLQQSVRNRDYKLIRLLTPAYDVSNDTCPTVESLEFYRVDQARPIPKLDRPGGPNDLGTTGLAGNDLANYTLLVAELNRVNGSVIACDEDGNLDGVIDAKDLADLDSWITKTGGKSSWFDVNRDGLTDAVDRQLIANKVGTRCAGQR
jgi:hypothetical protein